MGKRLQIRHKLKRLRGLWGSEKLDGDLGNPVVLSHLFGTGDVLNNVYAWLTERRVGEIQVMKTLCMGRVHQMSEFPSEGLRL